MKHRKANSRPHRSSFTKAGEIYVAPCNASNPLFPLDEHPSEWASCGDAYEFTWQQDFGEDLVALSNKNLLKLSHSMGFCPHNRCQLSNVSSTKDDNLCPENLCYTKIENGGKSYGACCFTDGRFNSGNLIGFYDKTQHTPKPIYKHSRIVLGDILTRSIRDKRHNNLSNAAGSSRQIAEQEGYDAFINANILFDGMIATQCPLPNTFQDVTQMIIEQNVSLWIQLAPNLVPDSDDAEVGTDKKSASSDMMQSAFHPKETSNCMVFPNAYLHTHASTGKRRDYIWYDGFHRVGSGMVGLSSNSFLVQTFHIDYFSTAHHVVYKNTASAAVNAEHSSPPFVNTRTQSIVSAVEKNISSPDAVGLEHGDAGNSMMMVTGVSSPNMFGASDVIEIDAAEAAQPRHDLGGTQNYRPNSVLELYGKNFTQRVEHIWYHKWQDFHVPRDSDRQDMLIMVDRAVDVIRQGGTVAVSCLSGRGRTGTFAALVVGRLHDVKHHDDLVDIIVQMRENRDGVVETPQQYRFVAETLGISSPAVCGTLCQSKKHIASYSESQRLIISFLLGLFLVLVPVLFIVRKQSI